MLATHTTSGTATKRWNNAYANNLTVDNLTLSGNITVQGLNLTARPGKVIYVATNGSDSNSGTHQNDPYATIEQALSVCVAGDHVHVLSRHVHRSISIDYANRCVLER